MSAGAPRSGTPTPGGTAQLERLCQLYAALRLFTNIYQPSAKRIPFEESDRREGRRPRRRHDQPLTVGVASVDNIAKALRRCNSNAIRWTCWRRFGGTKLLW